MDHVFRIDLRGIIDLLSNHLYSGPHVFVRELLQNSVDAIRARRQLEPLHEGAVAIDVIPARKGAPPSLVFEDDGVGLTEDEVHKFLATIGASSKRDDLSRRRSEFLGQFGIGLLSCFLVSEEIVLVTRSARGGPAIEWRGRPDGTYSVRALDSEVAIGTRVFLRCREGCESWFEPDRVRELARHFGGLLPTPIRVGASGGEPLAVNAEAPPWRRNDRPATRELLEYGRRLFGTEFFDAIPLRAPAGGVEGVAFVLASSPSLASKPSHRVYLKGMLLSEKAHDLLPEWAFFVRCVIDASELRPTASRESFYEDETLAKTREALGDALRAWLVDLARRDPPRVRALIAIHHLAIKALATKEDELFRLFIDYLPFETTLGRMTLPEYLERADTVRWVATLDQFRQIAQVASAQSLCVLNGGYAYDAELIERLPDVRPGTRVERVDSTELVQDLETLGRDESERAASLVEAARRALRPFRCEVEVRKFRPREVPALYSADASESFRRSISATKQKAPSAWGAVLDSVASELPRGGALLCFNYANPVVHKAASVADEARLARVVQMLYVQALLLARQALHADELRVLNEGLLDVISWGLEGERA